MKAAAVFMSLAALAFAAPAEQAPQDAGYSANPAKVLAADSNQNSATLPIPIPVPLPLPLPLPVPIPIFIRKRGTFRIARAAFIGSAIGARVGSAAAGPGAYFGAKYGAYKGVKKALRRRRWGIFGPRLFGRSTEAADAAEGAEVETKESWMNSADMPEFNYEYKDAEGNAVDGSSNLAGIPGLDMAHIDAVLAAVLENFADEAAPEAASSSSAPAAEATPAY